MGDTHRPDQIYHVTVMPCYDKKLEASRQDFYNEAYATRDVDCVITTGELQLLMQDKGWDLSIPVPDENVPRLPAPAPAPPVCHAWYVPSNGANVAPRLAHLPSACRGSAGIQPFSSPSWYDQSGAWTEFVVVEFPIFHVQKNQSPSASMLARM